MTKVTSAVDARRNLGQLLNTVSLTQEDVIIERAGKPIARLTSCETTPASSEGKLDLRRARAGRLGGLVARSPGRLASSRRR